ncbi:MAG: two-component sensor histidine kinase [Desulfovibrio sp.]|nr:two-component sensor histidine kinase [Desulfovibrio sp.]
MTEAQASRRKYARIYRRILVTLLLLALTPLIALGVFCLNRINALYDEKINAGIEALTNSKRRALETFVAERLAQIKTLAFTHPYAELARHERLSEFFTIMQQNSHSFADLGIIGMDGRHVAYVGPYDLHDADYSNELWFRETLRKGLYISDVFMGFRQVPHFIIAVLRHTGERSFIMRATIDMDAVDALLERHYSGRNSDAFLLNSQGVLQSMSRFHGEVMGKVNFPVPDVPKDGVATFTAQGEQGRPMLAAVAPLKTIRWFLVVEDDVTESLRPLQRLKMFIVVLVAFGGVLVIAGALLCSRLLIESLAEADKKQAHIDARLLQSSKMAALGKMAAGVAHEINNPLMLIQENAGWIRDLLADEDPAKMQNFDEIVDSTAKIESHVARAKGITQRMLGFGRRMNPGRTEIFLNQLAEQAIAMLKTEATARNIEIVQEPAPHLPVILSDQAQLEQVFINIIDNAIDAIGRDGKVTVSAEACPEGVRISFKDTGPGMDEETRRHIFDPFFTTKNVGEGTGLGLAICYSILGKLGGRIEVVSRPGQGATFIITLPLEAPVVQEEAIGAQSAT